MKSRISVIEIFFLIPVGIIVSIILHEFGHMIVGIICGTDVRKIQIGIFSYVELNIDKASSWQVALISVGSFIVPEVMYLFLLFFRNPYITVFRISLAMLLYANIIGNTIVLIFGTKNPEEWDMCLFQNYSEISTEVIVVFLLLAFVINICLEITNGGLKKLINEI